jgi:hypothetical protein
MTSVVRPESNFFSKIDNFGAFRRFSKLGISRKQQNFITEGYLDL